MKKVLFVAMAALAITGCSQNEEFENEVKKEIGFNSAAVTRADHATTQNFSRFKTFAYSHAGDYPGTELKKIIDGAIYNKPVDSWEVVGGAKFYWPAEDNVSFFAYSSAGNKGEEIVVDYTEPATSAPKLTYTVASAIADQKDLIVAHATGKNATTDAANGVALNFKHALSQICFKLKREDTSVSYAVSRIAIKGALNKGTFTYATDNTTIGSWETTTDVEEKYEIAPIGQAFAGTDTDLVLPANYAFLLMPQAQESLANVTIDIDYVATKDGVTLSTNSVTGLKLPTLGAGSSWDVSKKTTYSLLLSPGKDIVVTGSYNGSWTEDAGDTTNP